MVCAEMEPGAVRRRQHPSCKWGENKGRLWGFPLHPLAAVRADAIQTWAGSSLASRGFPRLSSPGLELVVSWG